jgi:hypothetical protein
MSDDTKESALADYIVEWLTTRNRSELAEAFGNMRVRDFELLKDELRLILKCGGKPPNWIAASKAPTPQCECPPGVVSSTCVVHGYGYP